MSNDEIHEIWEIVEGYQKTLRKTRLRFLIFGPGKDNPDPYAKDCYGKRLQLKEVLKNENHFAILPEEAYNEAKKQGKDVKNITDFERYLIEDHCDIAFFLYLPNCIGLDHELSFFSARPECVRKLYCFYANDSGRHWSQEDKFDFIQVGGGQLYPFSRKQITDCDLNEKVLEVVGRLRIFSRYFPHKKYKGIK